MKSKFIVNKGGSGRARSLRCPELSEAEYCGGARDRCPWAAGNLQDTAGRAGAGSRAAEADAVRVGRRRGEPRGSTQVREGAPRGGSTLPGGSSPRERGRGQWPSRSGVAEMRRK